MSVGRAVRAMGENNGGFEILLYLCLAGEMILVSEGIEFLLSFSQICFFLSSFIYAKWTGEIDWLYHISSKNRVLHTNAYRQSLAQCFGIR